MLILPQFVRVTNVSSQSLIYIQEYMKESKATTLNQKSEQSQVKQANYLCLLSCGFFVQKQMALILDSQAFCIHVISILNHKPKQCSSSSFKINLARSKVKRIDKAKMLIISQLTRQANGKFMTKKHKLIFYHLEHVKYWEQLIKQTELNVIMNAFQDDLYRKTSIDSKTYSIISEKDQSCSNFLRVKQQLRHSKYANRTLQLSKK